MGEYTYRNLVIYADKLFEKRGLSEALSPTKSRN